MRPENVETFGHEALEKLLANLLHYGTWVSSAVIAAGLLTTTRVVTVGIALLILLPVLRVTLVLIVFLRERDYRFGAIAALVLLIIVASLLIGIYVAPVA
jgi:uncharacterized membrane protein